MNLPLFNLGFRPFFLCASLYAAISVLVWGLIYTGKLQHHFVFSSPMIWHAHEMVFGYAVAVIAGFLLTAVKNWTGIQTPNGWKLLSLVLIWLFARLLAFVPNHSLFHWQFALDNVFLILLILSIAIPIIKSGNKRNLVIVTKIILILASNIVFYLGVIGYLEDGERIGLYSAIYLILALILTLARRVIPTFIERGVGYPVTLRNSTWVDLSSLFLFLIFWIAEIIEPNSGVVAVLAGLLFVIHSIRLSGWHTSGIWKQPLLWVLFIAYGFLTLGFLLKALAWFIDVSPSLALHAFTYGGIGMITIGMMARVTLGHTGREIYAPAKIHSVMFVSLLIGAIIRVLVPLFEPMQYSLWITLSYLLWSFAFGLFVINYAPKLIQARVDGKPG